jgi:hypothetical protein
MTSLAQREVIRDRRLETSRVILRFHFSCRHRKTRMEACAVRYTFVHEIQIHAAPWMQHLPEPSSSSGVLLPLVSYQLMRDLTATYPKLRKHEPTASAGTATTLTLGKCWLMTSQSSLLNADSAISSF